MSKLALLGGSKSVEKRNDAMFHWPIVNQEMRDAVMKVLEDGSMSGIEITQEFEQKFAEWSGVKYALACPNGTDALREAMFAVGVGMNSELICPSVTYWASCMPAIGLGARVVFADIEPDTLCLDPKSFEAHVTPRTKAVVVVHYLAHPADMDPIMEIARRHGIKVIEDVSHAHGALYKGRKVGTFGDVAACSMMSGKSFAVGEAGMLYTNDRNVYEKAITFGHYERIHTVENHLPLPEGVGYLPWGGCKHRTNQMCSALGLCQLKKYDAETAEIHAAMSYFTDQLARIPGLYRHYPSKWKNSTKGGWYCPHMFYDTSKFGGLSLQRFCEALRAEGVDDTWAGCNTPLHRSTLFSKVDIFGGLGRPTANLFDDSDAREQSGSLPISERVNNVLFALPSFKHDWREEIDQYLAAYVKVAENYQELLPGDNHRDEVQGLFFAF
ncbi:MAG: DegT/DnrJ/EryC1/StrS family aminotransferase [Lentisphaeria bacterium]|nr:DegT/DnrJ/EryC1/StrS family aminotransferase [Lentisphaeria bacterium]